MSVPPLEISMLKTFQQVAESRSISKTANEMYLSVSTVTGRIKSLEKEIGAQLFIRTGRRIELTDAGAAFIKNVKRFIDLIEEGKSRIHSKCQSNAGDLHVAATPFFTSYILPDMIKRFREEYPMVRLKLSACSNSQVLNLVSQGKADIGMYKRNFRRKAWRVIRCFMILLFPYCPRDII
jgi:LysR family transcriptional repressor of citA